MTHVQHDHPRATTESRAMNTADILPPLPSASMMMGGGDFFTADQMHSYALTAAELARSAAPAPEPSTEMMAAIYKAWDSFGDDATMGPEEALSIVRAVLACVATPHTKCQACGGAKVVNAPSPLGLTVSSTWVLCGACKGTGLAAPQPVTEPKMVAKIVNKLGVKTLQWMSGSDELPDGTPLYAPTPQAASREASQAPDFIRRTNEDYAAWARTVYTPEFCERIDLHGLWAWQEQERRKEAVLATPQPAQFNQSTGQWEGEPLADYPELQKAVASGLENGTLEVGGTPQPVPSSEPVALQDIEQYRMQMAGICTAALGGWKEGDPVHPDYNTPALRDVARLYAKYDSLYRATVPAARAPAKADPDVALRSNDDKVICPNCVHEFRAVPVNAQIKLSKYADLADWIVERWHAEVANRPMENKNRRSLDDTWRQVLRHLGVDDRERLGPTHDDILALATRPQGEK